MYRLQETYQNKTSNVLFEWKQTASTKTYWEVHTNVKGLEFCMKRIHKNSSDRTVTYRDVSGKKVNMTCAH